jgi:hypothetical protein
MCPNCPFDWTCLKPALPPVKMATVEIDGRRRDVRFAVDHTVVQVRLGGREQRVTALIVEVSKSGFRLTMDESVPFGVLVCVEMPGFSLLGDVRYCQPLPGNRSYFIGVELRCVAERS